MNLWCSSNSNSRAPAVEQVEAGAIVFEDYPWLVL